MCPYYVILAVCLEISPHLFIHSICVPPVCLCLYFERQTLTMRAHKETVGQCSIVRIEDKNTARLEMT